MEADGDEVDGHMQNEMEDEDTDGYSAQGDDSDGSDGEENTEEVPNPAAWNQDHSSAMTVNDGHDSAWQYHENNIAKGAMYTDKQALRDAVIKWALSTHRVLKTVVSSQKYLTMECEDINCPGRVHAHLPRNGYYWKISDFAPHSCVIDNVPEDHRNLSSTLIARLLYNEIVSCASMEVSALQTKVAVRFNYEISYGKAWRAKHMALENRFGSYFDSYDSVIRLLHTLQYRNPGTYVEIRSEERRVGKECRL